MTRIVAVRSAFPPNRNGQTEFMEKFAETSGLGPAQRVLIKRLHANAGVDTRYTVQPLSECGTLDGIEAANNRYIGEAADLGERARGGPRDGAAALVAHGGTHTPRAPRVIATRSEVYPDSGEALGWQLRSDCFRIVLSGELADLIERRVGASVT